MTLRSSLTCPANGAPRARTRSARTRRRAFSPGAAAAANDSRGGMSSASTSGAEGGRERRRAGRRGPRGNRRLHALPEVAIRRRDEPHVDVIGTVPPLGGTCALDDAQELRPGGGRQLSDLVQEERPPSASSKRPARRSVAPVRAALVSEELFSTRSPGAPRRSRGRTAGRRGERGSAREELLAVPDSPVSRTVTSDGAACRMRSSASASARRPTICGIQRAPPPRRGGRARPPSAGPARGARRGGEGGPGPRACSGNPRRRSSSRRRPSPPSRSPSGPRRAPRDPTRRRPSGRRSRRRPAS